MIADQALAYIYFVGVATTAALVVAAGRFGRLGGWSDGSWPAFALVVSWAWPVLAVVFPFAMWEAMNEGRCKVPWCFKRYTNLNRYGRGRCESHREARAELTPQHQEDDMQYIIPVTVKHPNGTEITAEAVIDDSDLDWFEDETGAMVFDLDQAEDIAREAVLDELTFAFGTPGRPLDP